ncbi:MAG TPA: 6-phosphogluconolactonase [Aestuariivirgaceae bacterium]|jgi:6-phosphogluconolactonase
MRHDLAFETQDGMAEALAGAIAAALSQDIAEKGSASLIVSGGRTPRRMFERLSRKALPWNKVKISLADERLVPATDPSSNERLVRDHLLQNEAQSAVFIPLWQGEGDPVESAVEAISAMDRAFAMVVLGMGEDGHFASLFPGMPGLSRALEPYFNSLAVFVPAQAGLTPRVSLTLATLLDTKALAISFEGEMKRRVLERALAPGPVEELPVRALFNQDRAPVDVYWSP